jgi:hypothetical protein
MTLRRSTVSIAATAALVTLLSCRDATSITLEVTTDLSCDGSANLEMGFAVGRLDTFVARPFAVTRTWCEPQGGHVGSLVLVPSGSDDEEIAVRVVGAVGRRASTCGEVRAGVPDFQGCIIERRVLRFVAHENQTVPVVLSVACTNVPCAPAQTCRAGVCIGTPGALPGELDATAPAPFDAAPPVDGNTPPPTCSAPSPTACCGKTGCYGTPCAQPAICTKCIAHCGTDPRKKCCVSATRIEADGLNKIDCKDVSDPCPL